MGANDPQIIQAVSGLFLVLTWVAVGLRCYCRIFIIKAFGTEDWFAVVSLASWTTYAVSTFLASVRGAGMHMADLPAEIRAEGLKYWWICEVAYVISTAALKGSVGFMLLHFVARKSQRIMIGAILGFTFLYSATFFFFMIFQCSPPSYFWDDQIGHTGTCLPAIGVGVFSIAYSIINALADLYFSILPIFVVRDLQMPRKAKAYVAGILGVGGLVSCAVIIRVPYLLILLNGYLDFLYYSPNVVNWSTTELGLGITAAALATLRPLFRNLRNGFSDFSTSEGTNTIRGSKARANSAGYIQSSEGSDGPGIPLEKVRKTGMRRTEDLEDGVGESAMVREASQAKLVEPGLGRAL